MTEYIFKIYSCYREIDEYKAEIYNKGRIPYILDYLKEEYSCFPKLEIKIFIEAEELEEISEEAVRE